MNRELRNIESIRPRSELFLFLTIPDIIFLVLVTGAFYLIRDLAFTPVKELLWIGTGINFLFLLKPSKNNPGKSHLIMMYLALRRYMSGAYKQVASLDAREYEEG